MAGPSLVLRVDDRPLKDMARKVRRALKDADTRELTATLGAEVLATTMQRFRDGKSPDGEKWPVTIRQKMGDPRPALHGTGGKLAQSYTYQTDERSVEIGSTLKYAAIHHFGGVIRARNARALCFRIGGEMVLRKAVTIPARPALGLSDEDETGLLQTTEEWIALIIKDFAHGR